MGGQQMLPRTVDGMKHVCYFRHALALDERRVKFLPEYAYGGTSEDPAKLDNNNSWPASESEFEEGSLRQRAIKMQLAALRQAGSQRETVHKHLKSGSPGRTQTCKSI